jgi:predicted nucleotidyltransferase/DNA-binding HxlR family transcriptional regulator
MGLANFLLGQTRSAVLGALFLRPESALHVRELARLTGVSPGSLHRELRALADVGLLIRQETGRQVYYRANQRCPVYEELTGLLRKTAGLVDVLRDVLLPMAGHVEQAFVYGSMARGDEYAHSDVDLLLIGDLEFTDAVLALNSAQATLRREINPTVMSRTEWDRKLQAADSFVAQVWSGPKLGVIGSQRAITRP